MPKALLTREEKLARKRESNRLWAEANREKVRESQRKYEAANKEKIAQYKAEARKADPLKFAARTARWRSENPEKARAYSAKRYVENKDAVLAQLAEWRRNNPERLRVVVAAAKRAPHRAEKRRVYARNRHATNTQARLATLLRNRVRKAMKGGSRSLGALVALGCSLEELRAHLESQFVSGMTWGNHGNWHIDHRRPLASFDLSDPHQYAAACHYTNLQPLWGRENQSKGARYDKEADARPEEYRMD